MKIEINVDTDNHEGTSYPWWIIIDPRQNFNVDEDGVYNIAHMITGPFFSRKEAQSFLDSKRYNFSKNAKVYCHSGYSSIQYKKALCHI